jgi:hypothetical protein
LLDGVVISFSKVGSLEEYPLAFLPSPYGSVVKPSFCWSNRGMISKFDLSNCLSKRREEEEGGRKQTNDCANENENDKSKTTGSTSFMRHEQSMKYCRRRVTNFLAREER